MGDYRKNTYKNRENIGQAVKSWFTWDLQPIYANMFDRVSWERQVSHSGYRTGGDEGR